MIYLMFTILGRGDAAEGLPYAGIALVKRCNADRRIVTRYFVWCGAVDVNVVLVKFCLLGNVKRRRRRRHRNIERTRATILCEFLLRIRNGKVILWGWGVAIILPQGTSRERDRSSMPRPEIL